MNRIVLVVLAACLMTHCKNDKPSADIEKDLLVTQSGVSEDDVAKAYLTAELDRLRIRKDSSLSSGTVVTISEGDSLIYLEKQSVSRPIIRLRGKYHYAPWLRVEHLKTGKKGWVYAGAVDGLDDLASNNPIEEELNADDFEWEGTVPTGWGTAGFSDARDFKIFLLRFKELIKKNEQKKIAALLQYPIKDIKAEEAFLSRYNSIITTELREVIMSQRLDRIFRNSQGAMIGDGQIWFGQVRDDYKITSIDFKSREDVINSLMSELSGYYNSEQGGQRIRVSKIKNFLELSLSNPSEVGRSLGRYTYTSSQDSVHSFIQDGTAVSKLLSFNTIAGKTILDVSIPDSQDSTAIQMVRLVKG